MLSSDSVPVMMTSSSTASSHQNTVVPSEVGWQFVPQYYTFVNKEPHRLHCFYNKNSTFVHGTEGEEGKPCFGQQEIHKKITSLGFEDCKVFIHSVDAQSSANSGIIIQVIGEMSNHGEPWRKFVQTFFLAEQPNGYFVLNDIFRYLKEETVEGDDAGDSAEVAEPAQPLPVASTPEQVVPAVVPVATPEPVFEQPREATPPPPEPVVPEPSSPAAGDEEPTTDVAEPVITQTPTPAPEQQQPAPAQTNGIHTPEPEKAAPAPAREPTPAPVVPAPQPAATPTPPVVAAAAAAPPPATKPAPASKPTPAAAPATPAAPQPTAPAAPRSWASLAASNQKKWGAGLAQEARGVTETIASPAPSSGAQTPISREQTANASHGGARPNQQRQNHHQHQQQGQGQGQSSQGNTSEHPALLAAQSVTHAQCFVKGVTDPISQSQLATTLSTRFGAIKDLEIVRAKACAFLEFNTVESARRAIAASLNQHQGGEGGVWVDAGGEAGQIRIWVETKKERSERAPARPRGGAPPAVGTNGDGPRGGGPQGGFRGRGANRGARGGGGGGAPQK